MSRIEEISAIYSLCDYIYQKSSDVPTDILHEPFGYFTQHNYRYELQQTV